MLRYDLADLAKARHRKGTEVELPMIHGSPGAEKAYLAALRKMLKAIAKAIGEDILPVVERELAAKARADKLTRDIDWSQFNSIELLGNALARVATTTVNRVLTLESRRHSAAFMQSAKRALGVDLSAVVRENDLEDTLENIGTRNAGLIRGLAQQTVQRVQNTVTSALLRGAPVSELKKELKKDFDFSDRRAALIARDQVAKVNSELNEFRQRQAGIKEYYWRTVMDERVRPLHRTLDGRKYKIGQATGAEGGLPPGRPIQCRCIAQAVVKF